MYIEREPANPVDAIETFKKLHGMRIADVYFESLSCSRARDP